MVRLKGVGHLLLALSEILDGLDYTTKLGRYSATTHANANNHPYGD